jgi:single-strand DNA-binding protein
MAGINKVILVGNVGRDPEVRTTPSGQQVAKFSLATSENFTSKAGEKQERTEWHNIVVWGKLADLCKQYVQKGRQIYVEGRLQTSSWNDPQGNKKYRTEIVAQTVQFLGRPGERQSVPEGAPQHGAAEPDYGDAGDSSSSVFAADDDLPF